MPCIVNCSNAHVEVMRFAQPGMVEYEPEAKFMFEIYRKGGAHIMLLITITMQTPFQIPIVIVDRAIYNSLINITPCKYLLLTQLLTI